MVCKGKATSTGPYDTRIAKVMNEADHRHELWKCSNKKTCLKDDSATTIQDTRRWPKGSHANAFTRLLGTPWFQGLGDP